MSSMALGMVFFMLLGGSSGGDLLDYMDSDYYWQQQGVLAVTPEAMIQIIEDDEAGPTQQLMAIRTLGILGEPGHLPKLEPLVDSKQPFVGQYAKRSIAWIKGEDPEPMTSPASELLARDVALLRPDATLAGHFRTLNGTMPVDLKKMIPNFPPDHWQSREEVLSEMNSGIYEVVNMIGNARLDAISFSISFDKSNDGPVVLVARGAYDRFAVIDTLNDLDEEFNGYSVEDIEVMQFQDANMNACFIMPSDEVFIAVLSESSNKPLPVNEILESIQGEKATVAFNDEMRGQYEKIDHAKVRGWFITSFPPVIFQETDLVAIFGPFEAARLTATDQNDGGIRIDWVGEGSDEAAIAESVNEINGMLAEGRAEMRQMQVQEPAMAEMFAPMMKVMDSIEVKADGKNMLGGLDLPPGALGMAPMWMMGF